MIGTLALWITLGTAMLLWMIARFLNILNKKILSCIFDTAAFFPLIISFSHQYMTTKDPLLGGLAILMIVMALLIGATAILKYKKFI